MQPITLILSESYLCVKLNRAETVTLIVITKRKKHIVLPPSSLISHFQHLLFDTQCIILQKVRKIFNNNLIYKNYFKNNFLSKTKSKCFSEMWTQTINIIIIIINKFNISCHMQHFERPYMQYFKRLLQMMVFLKNSKDKKS